MIICPHNKDPNDCPLCTEVGQSRALAGQVLEAADFTPPEEWERRATLFRKRAIQLRQSRCRNDARIAEEASRECTKIAAVLRAAADHAPIIPEKKILTLDGNR